MTRSHRLLVRLANAITVMAVLLSMVGLGLGTAPVRVFAAPPYLLTSSLAAYWPLDELSGSRADIHSTNTLTATGPISGFGPSKIGNAAGLSVSANYLQIASNAALSVVSADDFSITGWLRFTSKSSNQNIILTKASTTTNAEYILRYLGTGNGADYLQLLTGSGTTVTASDAPISADATTWYFFAAWKTGGKQYLQVNNGIVFSATAPAISNSGQPFKLGATLVGEPTFSGLIDELGFWRRALTATERQNLYASGSGCGYPFAADCFVSGADPLANQLQDGNMELNLPLGQDWWWDFSDGSGPWRVVAHSYTANSMGVQPACANQFQVLGGAGNGPSTGDALSNTMSQAFVWAGGTAYLSWSARGDGLASSGYTFLSVRFVSLDTGTVYHLAENRAYAVGAWDRDTETAALPPGSYEVVLSANQALNSDGTYKRGVFVDDVWLSSTAGSACGPIVATPTRTPTRTPTSTRTPTRTATPTGTWASPTPSRTPTAGPSATPYAQTINNCNFESGGAGWSGAGYSIGLAGGPVGPQYANLTNASSHIGQLINWSPTGLAYLSFWVGPQSYGEVTFVRTTNGQSFSAWVGNNATNDWVQVKVVRQLSAGAYTLEARSYNTFKWDGVALGHNGFTACGPNATPTSGPTSNVSATPSRTPTTGPSPTATITPVPSATRTPNPTLVAVATYTPRPTSSPAPTNTQTGPEKTSTAAGTTVPTYTPPPSTTPGGGPGGGGDTCDDDPENCPVPEQPEPAPNAQCKRPQFFWEVAQWIDYSTCRALSYVAWSPDNTDQVLAMQDAVRDREPFGTIADATDLMGLIGSWAGQIEFCDTGICQDQPLAPLNLEATGILTGQFDLSASGTVYTGDCDLLLDDIVGPAIRSGACFCVNVLCALGILPWSQVVFNFLAAAMVLLYLQRTWMKAAQN